MVGKSVDYWGQVGADLETHPPNLWWRAYCDDLNRGWLNQTLAGRTYRRALKTDLFDEAVGGGIEPAMADHLVGIDLAASTARRALQQRGLEVLAADVRRLPFRDGAFDLVVSLSTLDHFAATVEISHALREIRRVLAPGGMLALTLDNLSNPYVRLRNSLPWPLLFRTRLVPYFVGATLTRRQLHEALTASGFRVLHSTALMHTPRVVVVPLAERIRGTLLLRVLEGLELLGRLPTRYRTGLYLAVIAEATESPSGRS
jgi:SAM-dependent methyltransferase